VIVGAVVGAVVVGGATTMTVHKHTGVVVVVDIADPGRDRGARAELMPKPHELLLDEVPKPVDGAVVTVQQQLRECAHLGRAVPAVRAVHQHGSALVVQVGAHMNRRAEDL
jgi:hypothetical protein